MAAPWTTQRRPQPPTSLQSIISMEDWEAKSPLGELELRSVNSLKHICQDRRLPLKFAEEEPISRPVTPIPKAAFSYPQGRTITSPPSPSRPSTPSGRPEVGSSSHPHHHLHPKHPIQTPEQFHDWFALIERSVAHSQEAHFRSHLEDVSEQRMMCEKLLETVDGVESEVDGMLYEWRSVEEGGSSLKDACERLLEERDNLIETTEAIAVRLEYFQELDYATRMLNHPGESLVLQTDFLLMVERVDVCLEFLEAHRNFRESEIYLLRFRQCLTRAMTLIKMFFVGSLKALTADIQYRISDKEISDTAQLHLLYSKFSSASYQVAPLLAELERRAEAHPDELVSLLTECHTAYLGARKSLLIGRLVEDIKGLDPVNSELVELTRTGSTYLRQLCMDEFDMYRRFFNTGEDRLYRYLESLCDYLFDDLRPRILHEPRLTTLCEVCTVLQALMILDVQSSNLSDSDTMYEEDGTAAMLDATEPAQKGLGQLHIKPILQLVLQDAQTRLLFKAQALMESEIRSYKPKQDDLAYPDKLIDIGKTDRSGLELIEKEDETLRQLFPLPSLQKQATWYPTLRRTLWILSQLHEFVNSAVFADVSQEAITFCRQSLKLASEEILAKNPSNSYINGQLFLIRHLLILKDMTANLEFKERESRDRVVADALGSVIRGTSALLNSTGFFGFGAANSQNEMDARIGIDQDLKSACESLISRCADAATVPIRKFLERCVTFQASKDVSTTADSSSAPLALAEMEFASSTSVVEVDTAFRVICEKEISVWLTQLQLYLEDQRTISIMVAPLQAKIVEIYSAYRDLVSVEYSPEIVQALFSPIDFWTFLHQLCNKPHNLQTTGTFKSN